MYRPLSSKAMTEYAAARPVVFAALATLAALAMLMAFFQVVQGAVDRATLRRQAAALYADADWRCRFAPGQVRHPVLPDAGLAADGHGACR
jgi:hypothetical protein